METGMKKIASTCGIPVEKVMDFKLHEQYNTVLSEMAKAHQGTPLISVTSPAK